jgi:PLP dependent protein
MRQENTSPLDIVLNQIAHAAKIAARKTSDIELIAVSKTKSAEAIRPLINAGQRVFGENRVQEAQSKWPDLFAEEPTIQSLHLVGQLQSNKAEEAIRLFDVIHSVDRLSLITAIAKAQDKVGQRPRCFIQVNIGDEDQKGGCAVAEVPQLLKEAQSAALDVIGLMAVPPSTLEPAPFFALLAKLARDHGLANLSMGMSADIETAIMCGATHVRVGTALFGTRG